MTVLVAKGDLFRKTRSQINVNRKNAEIIKKSKDILMTSHSGRRPNHPET